VRFEHPVFQGPRKVDATTIEKVDQYSGKTIQAWRVQEDVGKPGLVATRRRFVGAADSEILSGGTNMKGDRGVPLVREGNLFLWGFSAAPKKMTPAGRAAFINAVSYIADFAGQAPVRRVGTAQRSRWRGVIESPYVKPSRLSAYFGASILAEYGADKKTLAAGLAKREAFLYVPRGQARWEIDTDAEALGHATDSLDLIRAALKAGDERGRRLLARYWPKDDLVMERPTTEEALDALVDQIYFSEYYGYRWLSRPPIPGPEEWEVEDALQMMKASDPSPEAPAIFRARLVGAYNQPELASDRRLGLVTFALRAEVLENWHLTIKSKDAAAPALSIDIDLPEGLAWQDDDFSLRGPTKAGVAGIEASGTLTWTRKIWIQGPAGPYTVKGVVRFQVCDEERCLAPIELPFEAKMKVR
jgi:hypothetical protein